MITVENVSKIYTTRKKISFLKSKTVEYEAVKNLSFSIEQGEKIAYIGSNGAGKSTTIKMLCGIMTPSTGKIQIDGYNPYKDRLEYVKEIGVVFGHRNQLFWDLNVSDSFEFGKSMYDISDNAYQARLKTFSKYVNLDEIWDMPVRKLSLGQKVRANISLAMLHYPKILFLDEPTIGLDIFTKDAVRDLLNHINETDGTTIMLTSHDMVDTERICNRIILLDKGSIVTDSPLDTFVAGNSLEETIKSLYDKGGVLK